MIPVIDLRRIAGLIACVAALAAVDLEWSSDKPAGWAVEVGQPANKKTTPPVARFGGGALEIEGPTNVAALAATAIAPHEADDQKPFRISVLVSASGERALYGPPAMCAVQWAGGAVFAVGIGEDARHKRQERRAWAAWSGNGATATVQGDDDLGEGPVPLHLRIVVTAREVLAYASADGWYWDRVASVPRAAIGAAGPVQKVLLGRGRIAADGIATAFAADQQGSRSAVWRFTSLRIETDPATVPAALVRHYARQESYVDTVEALAKAGRPTVWRLHAGSAGKGFPPVQLGPEGLPGNATDYTMQPNERFLQPGQILAGGSEGVRWASTTIKRDEPGWIRVLFDGTRRAWLWVDGRLVGGGGREHEEAKPDRHAVLVPVAAGEHTLVLGLRGSKDRMSAVLRWEDGDPRYRIGILRRLLLDFPDEGELAGAPFEIARLWEGLGHVRAAVDALKDVAERADAGEEAEAALAERARLLRLLGDEQAAAAEIARLNQRWSDGGFDKLAVAVRTARLWQRLDVPERAQAALADALAMPDLKAEARMELAVERARLAARRGDAAATAADLRAAAGFLPADDARRFDLTANALRFLNGTGEAKDIEALAAQAVNAVQVRRVAGICAARKDDAGRLAVLANARCRAQDLDQPAIEAAELQAAKSPAEAERIYRTVLERCGVTVDGTALPRQRLALARATIAATPAGVRLLAEADAAQAGTDGIPRWQVAGPWPLGNWEVWEKPPFDLVAIDGDSAGGKPWKPVPEDAVQGDTIDLGRCGMTDNAVMFLRTVLDADKARTVSATAGSDDALAVWVDGKPLYSDRDQRGIEPDAISLTLPLRKGRTAVVCAVQNGTNLSAFQMRLHRDSWPAADVAAALAALGTEGGRANAATRLVGLVTQLRRAGRTGEAAALGRAVMRLWPDEQERMNRIAHPALWERAWNDEPALVRELAAWFEGQCVDRCRDDGYFAAQVAELMPQRLAETGAGAEAVTWLRRLGSTELDPGLAASVALRESELWRRMGFARQAAAAAARAAAAATTAGDANLAAEAAQRQRAATAVKIDTVAVQTPFETAATLRSAAKAAASGETDRALDDWARLIEGGRDQVMRDGGALVGVAMHATAALRRAGDAVLAAWRSRSDNRAAATLARAVADADPVACERVAARWPGSTPAADALLRASELWAARGAWHLAQGAAARAVADGAPADRSRALARLAWCAARAGDRAACDEALAASTQPVRWDGKDLDPAAFAAAVRALLPPVVVPVPTTQALAVRLPPDAQAVVQATRVDGAHRSAAGLVAGDLFIAATTRRLVAVERATGTVRWQWDDDRPGGAAAPDAGDALPQAAVAAWDGVVIARLMRGGALRLVAVDAASGRVRWTSETCAGLADAAVLGAPRVAGGLVWAWFAARGRSLVVCLDAGDGRVVWSSALGTGPAVQPLKDVEMTLTGHAPAPLLVGGDLVVSTDAGLVGCFAAATGTLRWLHAYPRTCPDPQEGAMALERLAARGAGRLCADAQRIYCAPRDTLAVLALDRTTGACVWSADLEDARELVGFGPAGVVIAGDGVGCLDPASGLRRWRWTPGRGRVLGRPAPAGDRIWAATGDGLVSLDATTGAATAGPGWTDLRIATDDIPAALEVAGNGLIACGDGLVAFLAASGSGKQVAVATQRREALATGATPVTGSTVPTVLVAAWEQPVGRITDLLRPTDAQGGECYAMTRGRLLRLDAVTGAAVWTAAAPDRAMNGIQVAGDAVLVVGDDAAAVFDRADGRLRWCTAVGGTLGRNLDKRWNPARIVLDAGAVATFRPREPQWTVRDARDGRVLGSGRTEAGVLGLRVRGELIDAVVSRHNRLWVETLVIASGIQQTRTDLGIAGNDRASLLRLPDGSLFIAGSRESVRWVAGGDAAPIKVAPGDLLAVWEDGGRYVIASSADRHRYTSTILDPQSGKVLSSTLVSDGWRNHWWEAAGHFERLVGDLRMRGAERSNRAGVVGLRPDGSEAFWLPSGERWRRRPVALLPLASRGLYLTADRDGRTFGTLIDTAGTATVGETVLPGALAWPAPPPVACGAVAVYGTVRGLVGIVAAAAPVADGDAPAASWARRPVLDPLLIRKAPTLAIDGLADDWAGVEAVDIPAAAALRRDGSPTATVAGALRIRAAWTDDGLRLHGELPMPAASIERVLLAVDLVEHEAKSGDPALLVALDWDGGRPMARVLSATAGEDAARPRIQAACATGAGTAWELAIPWTWLWNWEGGKRPHRDHALKAGLAVWMRDAQGRTAALEWGDGIVRGLDRTGLARLRCEERKGK